MLSRYVVSQVKHNSYFLAGLALGLWVSLALVPLDEEAGLVCPGPLAAAGPPLDDYEPHREERPAGPPPRTAQRSVQRPRYYSTELGMRGSLLTGVLSSEEALKSQIAALNRTSGRLQPALKFFITASAMSSVPGLANVVGFTDTREMLKPFHALKYLADNYLEEYDFFFLVSDGTYVNADRLAALVARLSVSQHVFLGAPGAGPYCPLAGGLLLSNSVLRAVHAQLDWCVRNSYSPQHHENIGRCVLHAAQLPCAHELQGQTYLSVRAGEGGLQLGEGGLQLGEGGLQLSEQLADAVTVWPVGGAAQLYALHAYVARVRLQRERARLRALRADLWRGARRHPPHYRNGTWPGGLRADPGLAPPPPDNRFDHLRWVSFNRTHAFFPDDHHEVALVTGAHREALDLVLLNVEAWCLRRWPEARSARLVEGAYRWEPARALHYRLLLRLASGDQTTHVARLVEVVRPLGAARLVPVRYVTESATITVLLGVDPSRPQLVADAVQFLQRYQTVCVEQDKNTALVIVLIAPDEEGGAEGGGAGGGGADQVRAAVARLVSAQPAASVTLLDAAAPGGWARWAAGAPLQRVAGRALRVALDAALPHVARDALLLLAVAHADYTQDFLNRVRMNCIAGQQWYWPLSFSRYALYDNPRFVSPGGGKPSTNTGRFSPAARPVLAAYRGDLQAALAASRAALSPAEALARSPLHCVRAPEPALVLAPRPPPCAAPPAASPACARHLQDEQFEELDLGARHSLAQLLLEHEADSSP